MDSERESESESEGEKERGRQREIEWEGEGESESEREGGEEFFLCASALNPCTCTATPFVSHFTFRPGR